MLSIDGDEWVEELIGRCVKRKKLIYGFFFNIVITYGNETDEDFT